MKKHAVFTWLYAFFIAGVALFFVFQVKQGNWLQTNLQTLLPKQSQWAPVQVAADKQQETQLNRQIIAIVGHADSQKAFELAGEINRQWEESNLFSAITYRVLPDIGKLQQEIKQLALATLPESVRNQLFQEPQRYFQQYAEQIINPFEKTSLLTLEQDWLGFGRFAQQQTAQGNVRWNGENGMLYITTDKATWVLLRGELAQSELMDPSEKLTALLTQNSQYLNANSGKWRVTGSSLFAADAKQKAESESTKMSILGVSLTLLLLLAAFRTCRILWLFLPIAMGMLCGLVATVLLFEQVHILTLVIGTSLVGVLIDFPLHWLAGSLFSASWHPFKAMMNLRFTFLMSLLVTLLGYGLLGFTELPILQQTALFSAVALVAAVLATQLFLPRLLRYQAKPFSFERSFFRVLQTQLQGYANFSMGKVTWLMVGIFTLGGIVQSQWQDDIRQWVAMPQRMLNEAKQISELAGVDLGSQYFLVTAESDDALLEKNANLSEKLTALGVKHQALSQWILSQTQQRELALRLSQHLQAKDFQALVELGIPAETLHQSVSDLPQMPTLSLQSALATKIGQKWQPFYLGKIDGVFASIIKVQAVNSAELAALSDGKSIFWQDKRAELNQAFQHAKEQAAWLKVASFVLAALLLWKVFGSKTGNRLLLVPAATMVFTIALCGWLGLSIGLFAMFGLLLVSAISVDYAVYMQTVKEQLFHKQITLFLAACTTLISFGLLAMSSTPAVASFGICVSLGVIISLFVAFKIMR